MSKMLDGKPPVSEKPNLAVAVTIPHVGEGVES